LGLPGLPASPPLEPLVELETVLRAGGGFIVPFTGGDAPVKDDDEFFLLDVRLTPAEVAELDADLYPLFPVVDVIWDDRPTASNNKASALGVS